MPKLHHMILALSVAALLAVAVGCAMLPHNEEAVKVADEQRDALVELRASADPATQADIDAELAELRLLRREILARDAGEKTSQGLGALDVILGLLGAGGVGGVLSRLGPSRSKEVIDRVQNTTDDLWDKLAQTEAVIAALRATIAASGMPMPPTSGDPPSGTTVTWVPPSTPPPPTSGSITTLNPHE